jgi:hypothetical protein
MSPDNISVRLDSVPRPYQRDWLEALHAAGSRVSWNGVLPATGVEIVPVAAPTGGYNIYVTAPSGAQVVVGDAVGTLDTVKAAAGGARVMVPSASGTITASSGGSTARTTLPDTPRLKRVLVIGSADWETKFVIAALEEDGWKVDSRALVAPGVSVTQGGVTSIDTTRYAAVIALGGTAGEYASGIARYVANGGGLVMGGAAANLAGFSALRAGAPGRIETASVLATEPGSVSLQSLSFMPIMGLKSDAVALANRRGSVAVAARRFGGGRVVQTGYLDTWRWRMGGAAKSVEDHRRWWTNAVAGVAYAPAPPRPTPAEDDAPLARLVASLGQASVASAPRLAQAPSVSLWWLFTILSISLLAEWISRRTRGMR